MVSFHFNQMCSKYVSSEIYTRKSIKRKKNMFISKCTFHCCCTKCMEALKLSSTFIIIKHSDIYNEQTFPIGTKWY